MKLKIIAAASCVLLIGCASMQEIDFNTPETGETVRLRVDKDNEVQERTVYAWLKDERKLSKSRSYDNKERLKFTERYFYDHQGRIKEVRRYDPKGSWILKLTFVRDETGKVIKETVTDPQGNEEPYSAWDPYKK